VQTERQPEGHDLDRDQVRGYLLRHPGFLNENPDLLRALTPPRQQTGDTVIDFQHHLIERLQRDVGELAAFRESIIATSRSNHASQQHALVAALAAMEATSLEHLVHIITRDWIDMLDVDVVALCLADPFPNDASFAAAGISLIEELDLHRLFGNDGAVALHGNVAGAHDLYGSAASLVRAEALVRLDAGANRPAGILAIGSRDPGHFAPGQGTELLRFLGAVTERLLDQWLKASKP